jgi:hypothetical protein
MDRRWAVALVGPLCIALGVGIAVIVPASADERPSPAGTKSEHVSAATGDAIEHLYFPPPLTIEPLVPPVRPEDELERDPGGVLVLPNTRANPSPGGCFRNGATNICAQNETTIAVNPTDHDNWVGGANDYSGTNILADRAQSSCGFYFSTDAAQTWQGGLLPIQPGYTGGGDPSVAFDKDGNVYYACLNFELIPSDDLWDTGDSGMFVFKSTDGGATFTGPTEVVSSSTMGGTHDKEFIAVGALTDKVYMSWVHGDDIRFAGSDDEAATFDAPAPADNVLVNDPENDSNQGPVIATVAITNPEGLGNSEEVYVAWYGRPNGDTPARILFDKSTNNGASFGTDIVVENGVHEFPTRQFNTLFGTQHRASLLGEFGHPMSNPSNAFRANSFPSMAACKNAASPFFGQVYIVFADNRFGDGDIFFKKSEDRGDHWPGTLTRRVNDDPTHNGKDQFFPWISVDENCKINVSFYDRRDDENNQKFHLYFSHSTDGGETFSPNARVTTAQSTNAQFDGAFVGDYLQVASTVATSSEFHHEVDRAAALWMDTREGGQDVYAASLLQTQGGTWINVDVDLVADQDATDLHFEFPALTGEFGSFYHGPANPFQNHLVIIVPNTEETLLSFFDPEPGPLAPGDTAHVGFMVETLPEVVNSFWTGSGNIGSVPMATVDFTYDPVARVASASICNDREDGRTIGVSGPRYALLVTPIELEDLNATQLPAALAARNAGLSALPAPAGPLAPGSCASLPIPDSVRQFEAILLTATLTFVDGKSGGRVVLFAQKIAKDAREVRGKPDRLYRYAAKLVCGTQPNTKDLRLARGHYATTINILNPGPRPARIEKTLALAIPPGWQKPGDVRTIGREALPAAHALAVDCDDVRRRVFKGKLPASFIDGFVTIVSDRSLDVTGVYTTATLNAEGTAEDHSSIHLEPVAERLLRVSEGPKRADLVVDRNPSVDTICDAARCRVSVRFTVRNIGDGAAGAFNVALVRQGTNVSLANVAVSDGLEPGQAFQETSTVEVPVPKNPAERRICIRADAPLNQVPEDDETNNERCFAF